MATALVDKTSPTIRSTPDIGKINGMATPIVQVTKYTAKNSVGHAILTPTRMSVDNIIKLMSEIATKYGAGTYHFKVSEEGGSDEDSWTVKLGTEIEVATQENGQPNGQYALGGSPKGDDYTGVQVAPGWWYIQSLSSVITPQGKILPWSNSPFAGQQPPINAAQPQLPVPTPIVPQQQDNTVGLAHLLLQQNANARPARDDTAQREMEALKEQIRLQNEQRKDENFMRALTDMREGFTKVVSDLASKTDSKFEALISRLADTAKPSGPSETEKLLQQQIEEMRRREDENRREASLRTEMKAQMDMLASKLDTNKTDPGMMMLTQVMVKAMDAGAATTLAIQSQAQAQIQAQERSQMIMADRLGGSIMNPMQIVELLKMAKDNSDSTGAQKQMFSMFGDLMGMAKGMIREQAEMAGAGSGPSWMPLAEQGVQTVGKLATILAQRAATPAPVQMQRPVMMPPQMQQAPRPQMPQAPVAQPQPQPQPQRAPTPSEQSDAAAAKVFGTEALRDKDPAPAVAVPVPVPAATPVAAPVQVVTPDVVLMPQQQVFVHASPQAMAEATAQIPDPEFFGLVYSDVQQTRDQFENLTPDQIAEGMWMAYTQLKSMGAVVPCMEVLEAGHVDLVVRRMIPDGADESLQEIGLALRAKFQEQGAALASFPPPGLTTLASTVKV